MMHFNEICYAFCMVRLYIQSRRVNVEHVEQVVDAHLVQCPLDERRVRAIGVFVAVFLYLIH